MSDFKMVNTEELVLRDVDMARFFVKYAKENVKYLLKNEEDNVRLYDFYEELQEMEDTLAVQFILMKKEFKIEMDTVEERRTKKRKKKRNKRK